MLTAIVVLLTIIVVLLFVIAMQYQGFRFFLYDAFEWLYVTFWGLVGLVFAGGMVWMVVKQFL